MLIEYVQRRAGIRRFKHPIAKVGQRSSAELAHISVVFDQQHCLAVSRQYRCRTFGRSFRPADRKMARQIDLYRRAMVEVAVELEVPARLFNEAVNLAQPEAGSFA